MGTYSSVKSSLQIKKHKGTESVSSTMTETDNHYSSAEEKSSSSSGCSLSRTTVSSSSGMRRMSSYGVKKSSTSGDKAAHSVTKKKQKYAYIPDNFTSLEQVTGALRKEGLESSNLILGIDFTISNKWTGMRSFYNRSLHAVGNEPNPYEKAISIIGKTVSL